MAVAVTISFDLTPILKQVSARLHSRVMVGATRAINRTAASEKVAIAREVAKDMGLAVTVVKENIRVSKATVTRQVARLVSTGTPIPLIDFNASGQEPSRGKGRGVSYRIGSQGRKRIPTAFITRVTNAGYGNHRGVFVRDGKARLPIVERFGPSIAHVFGKMAPIGEQRRSEQLLKEITHEIGFALTQG